MLNQEHVETLYDCLDESATLLYKTYKMSYIEGIVKTCENIISNSIEEAYVQIKPELQGFIDQVSNISFDKEEIRKAFQYACLKGFKHAKITNQMITPETIGIFYNYLISKLYTKKNLLILDPLVGTGNLLTVVANGFGKPVQIIGCDKDLNSYKLSNALFDMLGYGEQIFLQDTLSFKCLLVDLIVSDFSGIVEADVYHIIGHHGANIKAGGFLIGIFDESVVSNDVLINHAKDLDGIWSLFGLIKLPENLTKNYPKSIVLFQRNGESVTKPKKFLLAELPELSNKEDFARVISQLNYWFKNIEFYKLGE